MLWNRKFTQIIRENKILPRLLGVCLTVFMMQVFVFAHSEAMVQEQANAADVSMQGASQATEAKALQEAAALEKVSPPESTKSPDDNSNSQAEASVPQENMSTETLVQQTPQNSAGDMKSVLPADKFTVTEITRSCADVVSEFVAIPGTTITFHINSVNPQAEDATLSLMLTKNEKDNLCLRVIPKVDSNGNLAGNSTDGYQYTASITVEEITELKRGDFISVSKFLAEQVETSIEFAAQVQNTKIEYLPNLKFTKATATVVDSENSNQLAPVDDVMYVVAGDCIQIELTLSDALAPGVKLSIGDMKGEESTEKDLREYLENPETYSSEMGLRFFQRTPNTITALVRLSNGDETQWQAERVLDICVEATRENFLAVETLQTSNAESFESGAAVFAQPVFWEPINPNAFSALLQATSLLETGYVRKGDALCVRYTGLENCFIQAYQFGHYKQTLRSPQETGTEFVYKLSETNQERYTSGEKLNATLFLQNDAGKEYVLSVPEEKSFLYVIDAAKEQNKLSFAFENVTFDDKTTPHTNWVSDSSAIKLTLKTNTSVIRQHSVQFTAASGATHTLALELVKDSGGNPVDGYTYAGTLAVKDCVGMQGNDTITAQVLRSNYPLQEGEADVPETQTPITYSDDLGGAEIRYVAPFLLESMQVRYPKSKDEDVWFPIDENAYAINGDFLVITLRFSHTLLPDATVVKMDRFTGLLGEKRDLEKMVQAPYSYKPDSTEKALQFYFDKTAIENDTIVCLFKISTLSDKNYELLKLSFQAENEQQTAKDSVPLPLQITTKRVPMLDEQVTVDTASYEAKKDIDGKELFHKIVYWAPLNMWNANVAVESDSADKPVPIDDLEEEKYQIVHDGSSAAIHFETTHPIVADETKTILLAGANSSKDAPEISAKYILEQQKENRFFYTSGITIGKAPIAGLEDLTKIKLKWHVKDLRGQTNRETTQMAENALWMIYYKPLAITDVVITSSNTKDKTQFCKDKDRIQIAFMANHYIEYDASIAGQKVEIEKTKNRKQKEYQCEYTLKNGDIKDLSEVQFLLVIKDLAGTEISVTNVSPEVKNKLKYFAPIEAGATIESRNSRTTYAKNGDQIVIATQTNHETEIQDLTLGQRKIGAEETHKKNPSVTYQIPTQEQELSEGELYYSLVLEDPAGNTEMVSNGSEKNKAPESKVIYDRSAPEIKILPGFNGFTNQDASFTFLYNDTNLDITTVSCKLNNTQRIANPEGKSEETSFSHDVQLHNEGNYSLQATVADMAGNEAEFAVSCNLIIDKTAPVIHMEFEKKTFRAGFALDEIVSVQENNIKDVLCTVTDNNGVQDWSFDQPLLTEGKKTVFALAYDMAGNASVPFTFDLFIDATAPKPKVADASTGDLLKTGQKNLIRGTSGALDIFLAPIEIGDERADTFTTLQLIDEFGMVHKDFLETENSEQQHSYRFKSFGNYSLLVVARDAVGNETGALLYPIEFREQLLLEKLLANTPMRNWSIVSSVNNTAFVILCAVIALAVIGIPVIIVCVHRNRKKRLAQKYIIVEDEDSR